jgi:DNA-binding LytR/AlgR family response regulator
MTVSALVVDDEAPARDELSYLLRTAFSIAPVDGAQNSSDAFRYLQERSYDVVFLDVRMPALNGIELGTVLRLFAGPSPCRGPAWAWPSAAPWDGRRIRAARRRTTTRPP